MPYLQCPHCGASREGLPDSQPCWRCRRLPTTPAQVQPTPGVTPRVTRVGAAPEEERPPYIPIWLAITGTLGIVLFLILVVGGLWLFLTAEDEDDTPEQRESQRVDVSNRTPEGATPGVDPTELDQSVGGEGSTGNPIVSPSPVVAVGPFAETADAMSSGGGPSMTPSMLPTPSLAPTATPLTPTPFACPGAPPARLVLNNLAEVVSANTIRLRANPGLETNTVLNVSPGEQVLVIEGPTCMDQFIWWKVRLNDDTEGWMAEGNAGQYFLEPRQP
ncbi:MAG: SH3 domain-containing protein [Chloroflexi bacterium]|nr:SH3 domain-containing protein [Chloroflexota bacterium]